MSDRAEVRDSASPRRVTPIWASGSAALDPEAEDHRAALARAEEEALREARTKIEEKVGGAGWEQEYEQTVGPIGLGGIQFVLAAVIGRAEARDEGSSV